MGKLCIRTIRAFTRWPTAPAASPARRRRLPPPAPPRCVARPLIITPCDDRKGKALWYEVIRTGRREKDKPQWCAVVRGALVSIATGRIAIGSKAMAPLALAGTPCRRSHHHPNPNPDANPIFTPGTLTTAGTLCRRSSSPCRATCSSSSRTTTTRPTLWPRAWPSAPSPLLRSSRTSRTSASTRRWRTARSSRCLAASAAGARQY